MPDKITNTTEITAQEMAVILGIVGKSVRNLTEDGILAKADSGKYNLCENVSRYCEYCVQKSNRKKPTGSLESRKLEAEIQLKEAKAETAQLELDELNGKMHRSEDVAAMTEDLIFAIRAALIAMPGRLAVDCSNASNAAECAEIIKREIYRAMEELTQYRYDPKKYMERVRERQNWDGVPDDE